MMPALPGTETPAPMRRRAVKQSGASTARRVRRARPAPPRRRLPGRGRRSPSRIPSSAAAAVPDLPVRTPVRYARAGSSRTAAALSAHNSWKRTSRAPRSAGRISGAAVISRSTASRATSRCSAEARATSPSVLAQRAPLMSPVTPSEARVSPSPIPSSRPSPMAAIAASTASPDSPASLAARPMASNARPISQSGVSGSRSASR